MIVTIMYFLLGIAEIPVEELSSGMVLLPDLSGSCNNCTADRDAIVEYRTSYLLYCISMLTFVGMFLFVLFGGIGLAALPMDLINHFRTRPIPITADQYARQKLAIGRKSALLIEKGMKLKKKLKAGNRFKNNRQRKNFHKFRTKVFILEEEYRKLEKSFNKGFGPVILSIFWDYFLLILGIVGIIITLLWVIHVALFLVPNPPLFGFLNVIFVALDNTFGLFGTIAYAIFSAYLLWCVVKGNFKFGLRVPLLFAIHPMKYKETLMNSFIFNVLLLMLASLAVTQFCTSAFSIYSRFTGIDVLFNVGVRHLMFLRYFWEYYYWGLLGVAALALAFLLICPGRQREESQLP